MVLGAVLSHTTQVRLVDLALCLGVRAPCLTAKSHQNPRQVTPMMLAAQRAAAVPVGNNLFLVTGIVFLFTFNCFTSACTARARFFVFKFVVCISVHNVLWVSWPSLQYLFHGIDHGFHSIHALHEYMDCVTGMCSMDAMVAMAYGP